MRQVLWWPLVVLLCCAAGAAGGERPPDARLLEAQAAFDEATKLRAAGRYSEATAPAAHALALREAALGGTHPDVASSLHLVGGLYTELGNRTNAEPLLQRALALREAALGNNHPDVAASLNALAVLYRLEKSYGKAEPLFLRALAIREETLGKNHPDVAQSLNGLGSLYLDQGLNDRAEPLFQRVLAIWETALGKNHREVAASLNCLAMLYKRQGLNDRAEPLYQRALTIYETALSKDHPNVAQVLHNLAILYWEQGLYGRVEPLHQRALAIREVAFGKNHPEVAISLNSLAILYRNQGLHGRAEPLYQRVLAIREAAFGKNHPGVAMGLNNLALLYTDQGLYDRAEALHRRALAIREAALGTNHPEVATSLYNLANLYAQQGLYDRAEPLHQRALAIREAALGKNHLEVIDPLNSLALLYTNQGLYDRAKPLLQRARAIQEAAPGNSHPRAADTLHTLARIYAYQGLYGQAEPLFQRALTIYETALGNSNSDVAETLNAIARLRLAQHRLADALPLFTRAFAMSERRLRQEALDFSESRLANFLHHLRTDEQAIYVLLRGHPNNARVRRLALSAVLLLKGRSIEETTEISRTLFRSLGAEDRVTFERLRGLRTQRAALSLAGPGALSPADYKQRLQTLADEGDALEADLARRSAPLRALNALPPPNEIVDRVAAALDQDSALVELITYVNRPLVPSPGTPWAKLPGQLRYLALVLFPDGSTQALDLGPAAPIDRAATRLRDALANRDARFQTSAQALYQLAFQPLLPLLGKTRRLFLSPDGQLGLVPFAALHDGHRFLLDSFDITYLTSGKDLLLHDQEGLPPSSVVVFADPDFQASPGAVRLAPGSHASTPAERSASLERFFSTSRAEGLATTPWVPLPGTRQEAESIKGLLPQAQLFLGPEATKQRLLELSTPGVLHLATHGFLLEDAPVSKDARGIVNFGALNADVLATRPPDPLLRSGLILAGVRPPTPAASDAGRTPVDNGLVTALELAGLDLWGTQLVVLSACDTGRGDVKLGQGVYGLRRAFVVAGAETVVMSLWQVSDAKTGALMDAYYRSLLAGQGRATALHEAMLKLRQTKPHPHYWAPFIAMGRDTPLRLP